jgi:hypothetical protein
MGGDELTPPPSAVDLLAPDEHAAQAAPAPSPSSSGAFELLFFDETPAESWLAHELELRDPRFVLKMTDTVVRRRARFAKYVMGAVGVSAALCLAAIVKAALPTTDDYAPAAVEALPAAEPPPGAPLVTDPPSPVLYRPAPRGDGG